MRSSNPGRPLSFLLRNDGSARRRCSRSRCCFRSCAQSVGHRIRRPIGNGGSARVVRNNGTPAAHRTAPAHWPCHNTARKIAHGTGAILRRTARAHIVETAVMTTRSRKRPSRAPAVTQRGQAKPRFPEIRFRIDFDDGCSVGVGKIRLLEAVAHTGSLSRAAREIAMSYRRAWLLIDSLNAEFDTRVVTASVGGSGGGGAKVTAFGGKLIAAYRGLEARLAPLTRDCMGEVAKHALGRPARSASRAASRRSITRPLRRVPSR